MTEYINVGLAVAPLLCNRGFWKRLWERILGGGRCIS